MKTGGSRGRGKGSSCSYFSKDVQNNILKVDTTTGMIEFPAPGEVKKQMLPKYYDEEEDILSRQKENVVEGDTKEEVYWMPDKYCKLCYACEELFTMFRRRHHCRMCGQVFCNQCSSYFIEQVGHQGPVRCCKLCYEQLEKGVDRDFRIPPKRNRKLTSESISELSSLSPVEVSNRNSVKMFSLLHVNNSKNSIKESLHDREKAISVLQSRASQHLEAIVAQLINVSDSIADKAVWLNLIVKLVGEVVACVDPDVKAGDTHDIRPYVKLKCIPGGSIDESVCVDGIVFRKNVSHKKMASFKEHPKILLIAGGIEFQRQDVKLSSLDTLLEQEEKYVEILVEKIMSLRPDIILVGKSVARKAQELLCNHNVVVMQNVKENLLERIARSTGAILLPSADQMIQQYGKECLGTCGKFWLKTVYDCDYDYGLKCPSRGLTKLTNNQKGVTYAYLEGCPTELGCTLILRGASKKTLVAVKSILSFSVMVAYHLRLEVSFYTDRCGIVAAEPYSQDDAMDEYVNETILTHWDLLDEQMSNQFACLKDKKMRMLLSTSLDVDISLPFAQEVRGIQSNVKIPKKLLPSDHQSLLVASLLMTESKAQRSKAEVKGIRYYTNQDVALGQFLIESCFQMNNNKNAIMMMLEHILSFIHRPGRIDISVSKASDSITIPDDSLIENQPFKAIITMHSYCKECKAIVTPEVIMTEDTWKMSFGKFLELLLYNSSARCRTGNCWHRLRDDHILYFTCSGYAARFEFIPIHAQSIFLRRTIPLPLQNHLNEISMYMVNFSQEYYNVLDEFKDSIASLERLIHEVLSSRPEVLSVALNDIASIQNEIVETSAEFSSEASLILDEISGLLGFHTDDYKKSISISNKNFKFPNSVKYPAILRRELLRKSSLWNSKIEFLSRFIQSVITVSTQNITTNAGNSTAELPNEEELFSLRTSIMLSPEQAEIRQNHRASTKIDFSLDAFSGALTSIEDDVDTESSIDPNPSPASKAADSATKASTRLAKVFNRFLGKESENQSSYVVPLTSLLEGRLTLEPGRNGSILEVHEDELSTVIAYSLSSQDYYDQILNFLEENMQDVVQRENFVENTGSSHEQLSTTPDDEGLNADEQLFEGVIEGYEDENILNDKTVTQEEIKPTSATRIAMNAVLSKLTARVKSERQVEEPGFHQPDDIGAPNDQNDSHQPSNPLSFLNMNNNSTEGNESTDGSNKNNLDSNVYFMEDGLNSQIQKQGQVSPNIDKHDHSINTAALSRESILLSLRKTHVKHRFADYDDKNNPTCKFICHTFWATQFRALRAEYLDDDDDEGYIRSLSMTTRWNAQGGKSGASFSRTKDGRFVVKYITRTELQMFLDFAPAYFEYMSKAFYQALPTVLCKILGVYQIGFHNRVTGKRVMEQVVVMENLFYNRNITKIFDLKGSSRARYVEVSKELKSKLEDFDTFLLKRRESNSHEPVPKIDKVFLDDNLMELTKGKPVPMKQKAKMMFNKAVQNDTLFLSIINIVDYSILVGFDEDSNDLVVGIIDYMRQYDIIKRMERMGKSVGTMIAGQAEPTVIQPPQYRKRFQQAMEKYFMLVPDKWITNDI